MRVEFLEVFLEISAIYESLPFVEKVRNDLRMETVFRCEDGTEWQIIKIGEVDLVAWLHVAQQLGRENEREENIDGEHEREVGNIFADERLAPRGPAVTHPNSRLRHAQQFQAKPDQPFRVHVVNDEVSHLLRVFERLGFSPVANAAPNRID